MNKRFLWLLLVPAFVLADNIDELRAKISRLLADSQDQEVLIDRLATSQRYLTNQYQLMNGGRGAFFVMGVSIGTPGANVRIPVTYVKGRDPIAAFQFDVITPSSVTFQSVVIGPAAIDANKTMQFTPAGRVIVFGFNETTIETGVVAIVTVRSVPTAPHGNYKVRISSTVAASPLGTDVPSFEVSGAIQL